MDYMDGDGIQIDDVGGLIIRDLHLETCDDYGFHIGLESESGVRSHQVTVLNPQASVVEDCKVLKPKSAARESFQLEGS